MPPDRKPEAEIAWLNFPCRKCGRDSHQHRLASELKKAATVDVVCSHCGEARTLDLVWDDETPR